MYIEKYTQEKDHTVAENVGNPSVKNHASINTGELIQEKNPMDAVNVAKLFIRSQTSVDIRKFMPGRMPIGIKTCSCEKALSKVSYFIICAGVHF